MYSPDKDEFIEPPYETEQNTHSDVTDSCESLNEVQRYEKNVECNKSYSNAGKIGLNLTCQEFLNQNQRSKYNVVVHDPWKFGSEENPRDLLSQHI